MLEPNAIVMYVKNLHESNSFYQGLLGISAEESSPTFKMFKLPSGLMLGLKDSNALQTMGVNSPGNELVFTVTDNVKVDTLFSEWQQKEMAIIQSPIDLSFGYTFLAQDPDGNRLRVVSLGKEQ
ncbi:bleomycin resistance protein [Legionella busanensis]|uniref:Bleomycin resistance protein n=1 Tax=Legionella busanensis TaxID=190655 RepID=A0A378JJC0_9GAMM|nr:VOC family protein [Legionella busanensis]STX50413.1 bleomycin resistance protein [Legionella busanensis]